MIYEHAILANQDEVLNALDFYASENCICTSSLLVSVMKVTEHTGKRRAPTHLVAADLLERYDALETKEDRGVYRLYGYDMDGNRQLLMVKCD